MYSGNGSTNLPSRLHLSTTGQHIAKGRLKTRELSQNDLARIANVERTTVHRFFKGNNLRFDSFDSICSALGLSWEEVGENPEPEISLNSQANVASDVDALVQQVRQQLFDGVKQNFGTVSLWGHRAKPMEDIFIDVTLNVNPSHPYDQILDEPTISNEFSDNDDSEIFDRLGHRLSGKTLSGAQAAQEIRWMYLDGKPGSGKTTYLHWITLQCAKGAFLSEFVPVFLSSSVFLETSTGRSLRSHIASYFAKRGISDTEAITEQLLSAGRLLLILDSFDDLPEPIRLRIQAQILELASHYRNCRIIVSCRPPVRLYLRGFDRVEIEEFRVPQITEFAKRWFVLVDGFDRSDRFLDRLRRHRAIGELAKTPLLLPMLCNVFAKEGEFPKNRMSLYRRGFELLLMEWDKAQYRHRNTSYEEISNTVKIELLSVIATHFFKQGSVLFRRREIEWVVKRFFVERLGRNSLEVDPSEILMAIELQHGLIVRRAVNYYSFSHLTFQEYLTAAHLESQNQYPIVYDYVTDARWKYVIEMLAELLPSGQVYDFLFSLKGRLNSCVANNSKPAEFIQWLERFVEDVTIQTNSEKVQKLYRGTLLRAHYFAASLGDDVKVSGFTSLVKRNDLEFPDYLSATSLLSGNVIDIHTNLLRIFYAKPSEPDIFFGVLKRLQKATEPLGNVKIRTALENWDFLSKEQLRNYPGRSEWWSANHNMWQRRAREVMNHHFQLRCDWNFSEDERKILRQYYNGTKLLAECLNLSNLSKISKENYASLAESLLKLEPG